MSAGRKCWAAYNSGTYASPVWVTLSRITEVKRSQSRGTGERMYRGAANKKTITGYMEYKMSFKYQAKRAGLADTVFDALNASFLNETKLDVLFLDQPLTVPTGNAAIGTSAKGVRGPYVVTKFDRDESDEDGVSFDVELAEIEDEQSGALVETVPYTGTVAGA